MLSYGFWQRRFGGDPNILGRTLTLNADELRRRRRPAARLSLPRATLRSTFPSSNGTRSELRTREVAARDSTSSAVSSRASPSKRRRRRSPPSAARSPASIPKTNAGHGAKLVRMKDDMVEYIRPTLLLLVGRGRIRADHRLRQRRQSAAGALHGAQARVRHSRGAGRRTRARGAPAADGERPAVAGRRRDRPAAGALGNQPGAGRRAGQPAALRPKSESIPTSCSSRWRSRSSPACCSAWPRPSTARTRIRRNR